MKLAFALCGCLPFKKKKAKKWLSNARARQECIELREEGSPHHTGENVGQGWSGKELKNREKKGKQEWSRRGRGIVM